MGYEMTVADCFLTKTDTATFIHVDSMRLGDDWKFNGNDIELNPPYYNALNDDLLTDLKDFQKMGVRGHFIVQGEQGEWEVYILDDINVKHLVAGLTWSDTPNMVFGKP